MPTGVTPIAAGLHRHTERLGAFEAAYKKRNENRRYFAYALNKVSHVKAHATGRLRFYQPLNLRDKDGYEFHRYNIDHDESVHRQTDLLQRRAEHLHAIGLIDQRGGEQQ